MEARETRKDASEKVKTTKRKNRGSRTVQPWRDRGEILRILGAMKSPRDKALFTLGIHVGLRGGDLARLDWAQFENGGNSIQGMIRTTEKKTGRTLNLGVPPAALRAMRTWWELCGKPTQGLCFPSGKGDESPLRISSLHRLVQSWCAAAGVEGHFGTHSMRKSFGYWFVRAGGSVQLLQHRFGHTSEACTLRYIGITDDDVRDVADKIDLTCELDLTTETPAKPKTVRRDVLVMNVSSEPPKPPSAFILGERIAKLSPADRETLLRLVEVMERAK